MRRTKVGRESASKLSLLLGLSLAGLSLMLARPPVSMAATLTVTSTADAVGSCPGASCTLRQAIATAAPGDTINFAAGITAVTLTSAELLINKNLTISGPGANLLPVMRSTAGGTPQFRIFNIAGGFNVTISGLTIANGISPFGGGGIFNGGTLTLTNSTISGDSKNTGNGGGIFNNGTLTITNSTISGNEADVGGGIANFGMLTITNSTLSGNSAASLGGGIYNFGGSVTITNSTISGNSASLAGGGIYFDHTGGGAVTVTNSTISGNSAGQGGGIYNTGGSTAVTARNTIIALNTAPTAPDFRSDLNSGGYNLIGNTSGTTITPTTGDQLNVNPMLGPLQDNGGPTFTHALLSGSPAIEGGQSFGSNTDQRGLARPVDSPVFFNVGDGSDIGAYEVQADLLPGCNTINRIVNNNNDSGTDSLRAVIANVCAGSTITFAPNVTGPINLTSGELLLNKFVTINGPGANLLSVQRSGAAGNFRIFNIAPASVIATISGLTIANGNSAGIGSGGGISNTGTLAITNSTISGNNGSGGSFGGGGIFNDGGTVTITNSTISGNTVGSSFTGGGIVNTGGTLTITNSTISGNSAGYGGGIYSFNGTVNLTNSTISSNSAFGIAGTGAGGGVSIVAGGGTVRARNTIIALNTSPSGPDVSGVLTSENFNLIGNNSGATITPVQFSDQIGTPGSPINPELLSLAYNGGPTQTHALRTNSPVSPAIDKGHSSGSTTDQRGFTRPVGIANAMGGDGSDIGAFEVQAPSAVKLVGFTATARDSSVLLNWQTGFEVNNLGFRIYRDSSGARTLLNQEPIAGSALVAGSTALTAGRSYSWLDKGIADCGLRNADCQNAQYWLEDLDLDGTSTWHGPFYVKQVEGKPAAHSQAALLSSIGQLDGDSTHVVMNVAELVRANQPASSPVSLQQASLASSRGMKIGVKQAGWYRIGQSELAAAGLDVKVDPRTLRLFVDGKELPITVAGEDDGGFDANDAVEFYGLGLNTPSTDTRVYWLVADSKQRGLRIADAPAAKGYSSGESFSYTVERRDRTIYFSALRNGDEENFFGSVVTGNPIDQKLTLNHISQSAREPAVIDVSLQGVTRLAHQVSVSLNGSSIGQVLFNGQVNGRQQIEVPHSMLREGDNVVTLQSVNGPSDVNLVDAIRVTYQHSYRAENDSLSFTAKSGETMTVGGFSTKDVHVFDVTDELDVQRLAVSIDQTKEGYSATVTAPPAGGIGEGGSGVSAGERKLLALTDARAHRSTSIRLNEASNWRDASNAADLVIITAREFFTAIEPLKKARQAEGYKVAVIDVEDLYDEFSFGNRSPNSVREFLWLARSRWKVAPRFVLLAGDASYDQKNYLGFGENDLVPTKLIDTAYLETASDDWFSDFDNDGVADMSTGRLPVRSLEEVGRAVAKTIRYQQTEQASSALLVSDQNDGFDFEQASSQLRPLIPSSIRIEELRRGELDPVTAKARLLDAIARGEKLINYAGHGSANQWRGSLLSSEDARGLTNGDRLPVFVMMTCLNGYFQDAAGESLAESLMNAEGGAIAVWASTGLTLPQDQAVMNQALYRLVFKQSGKSLSLGEATAKAKGSIRDIDIRRSWILLGDPTIRLK